MKKTVKPVAVSRKQPPIKINSEYFLTYGTLRLGNNNWYYHLKDDAEYLDTFKLDKFYHYGGISAGYEPDNISDNCLTVDLFKVKNNIEEVNRGIDSLEGIFYDFYTLLLVDIPYNGEVIQCKFYELKNRGYYSETQDFLLEIYGSDEKVFDNIMNRPISNNNIENFLKFYSKYEKTI